jgi:hypothetical protein
MLKRDKDTKKPEVELERNIERYMYSSIAKSNWGVGGGDLPKTESFTDKTTFTETLYKPKCGRRGGGVLRGLSQ